MNIPKRRLGKTEEHVTIIGLGGEGILRTYGYEREAYALINRALDLGITYCESARAYSGSESYYGKALRERRGEIFLASKSHARDKRGARAHLEESLRNMETDHLDLWQVHDVRTDEDVEEIFGPDGAIEAFAEAKEKGFVRFIGVTGHQDPEIIRQCIGRFDFDTVLMPVNPAEPRYRSFIDSVMPLAKDRDMGIVAMKVYFKGYASRLEGVPLSAFYRFALSHLISTAVIGCDDTAQLEQNVSFARSLVPMDEDEMQALAVAVAPFARTLMYYKP